MGHRELWKSVFFDTDNYLDFYFRKKAPISHVYSQYDGSRLASMAFYTPYQVSLFGNEQKLYYIVGVATDPEYRRQGRMQELMLEGMTESYESGQAMVYLSPADESFYQKLGFQGLYYREKAVVSEYEKSDLSVANYSRLVEERKEEVVAFVNQKLSSSTCHMFVKRDLEYYRLLRRELKAMDGGMLVFSNQDGEVVGTASLGAEGGKCEVYELICHRIYAEKVLNALMQYIFSRIHLIEKKVTIYDTEFLSDLLKGEKEEKSYIMGRVAHLANFLKMIPESVLYEAYEMNESQGFVLEIIDNVLPMNSGRYQIGLAGRSDTVITCDIHDFEQKVFPYLNAYINDIT